MGEREIADEGVREAHRHVEIRDRTRRAGDVDRAPGGDVIDDRQRHRA